MKCPGIFAERHLIPEAREHCDGCIWNWPDASGRQESSMGIAHRAYVALDDCVRALTVRWDPNIGATVIYDAGQAMEALKRLPAVLEAESDRYQQALRAIRDDPTPFGSDLRKQAGRALGPEGSDD